jgi:hypothetical protein
MRRHYSGPTRSASTRSAMAVQVDEVPEKAEVSTVLELQRL